MNDVLAAALIGAGATAVIDIWTLILKHAFNVPSLSFCLVGRWILHMPAGTFMHARIADAQPKPLECAAGWAVHYAIGVAYGIAFLCVAPDGWLAHPTVLPALLFGVATVLFPFLIMQPAFGLGIAAAKTPNPASARLKSLATHSVFGFGMFICALAVRQLAAG